MKLSGNEKAISSKTAAARVFVFFCLLQTALLLTGSSWAQQTARIPRIGFLLDSPASTVAARIEGFRQGLRELGYVEGKNLFIEWRDSAGDAERREKAAELVQLKVDVLISPGPTVTRTLKEATSTIPIVMGHDTDPVGSGF